MLQKLLGLTYSVIANVEPSIAARNYLEIRDTESLWIEQSHNRKNILYGLFNRPPNADIQYFSNIEDSIA